MIQISVRYIFIDLEKEWFYLDNDLLSSTFVKRWLCYNIVYSLPFDYRYVIELFDVNKMQLVNLLSTQYIHLNESGYEIREL